MASTYIFEPRDILQVDDPKHGWLTYYMLLSPFDGEQAVRKVRNGGGAYRIVRNGKDVVFSFGD